MYFPSAITSAAMATRSYRPFQFSGTDTSIFADAFPLAGASNLATCGWQAQPSGSTRGQDSGTPGLQEMTATERRVIVHRTP